MKAKPTGWVFWSILFASIATGIGGCPASDPPAEPWARHYNLGFTDASDDWAACIQMRTDTDYVVAGVTRPSTKAVAPSDPLLMEINRMGSMDYGRAGWEDDCTLSYVEQISGGYIVCGTKSPAGANPQLYVSKNTYPSLDPAWERTFGGSRLDVGTCVIQVSDGFVVAGMSNSFSAAADMDAYLIKLNNAGVEQWSKTYGGQQWDGVYSVQQTSDGGYILAGSSDSPGTNGGYDMFLVKTNALGVETWSQHLGTGGTEDGYDVHVAVGGGYLIAGRTNVFGSGGYDAYLVKTNEMGVREWSHTYGGAGHDEARAITAASTLAGEIGYALAGFTESSGAGGRDMYLIKVDLGGVEEWTRTFGGAADDEAASITTAFDGGYVLAGKTASFDVLGDSDVYIVKTDRMGTAPSIPTNGWHS